MNRDVREALGGLAYAAGIAIIGGLLMATAPDADAFGDRGWAYDTGKAVLAFAVIWAVIALIKTGRALTGPSDPPTTPEP